MIWHVPLFDVGIVVVVNGYAYSEAETAHSLNAGGC